MEKEEEGQGESAPACDLGHASGSKKERPIQARAKLAKANAKAKASIPLPADFPAEAGTCPAGQKSWVTYGPNGGRVQVVLHQKAFYVPSAPAGERHRTWSVNGGVVAAWNLAKERANF